MPAEAEFQYTILRVVPSIARGERINAGVVLFCQRHDFLRARVNVHPQRLAALTPHLDPADIGAHLDGLRAVADGDPSAGVLATLTPSQRFGWLTSPSSTVIQPSAVHTGLTADPEATLRRLFATLVGSDT